MRLKTIFLILFSILVLVVFVSGQVLSTTRAQEDTPTPPLPMATPMPGDPNMPVVGLPFSDTFDTNVGWIPSQGWKFDDKTAYSTGSWFADATPRGATSTLEAVPYIDLTGLLGAQLIFRQKGNLPESDFIAVDVSLDGGLTWIMVDQQIGVRVSDWEQHTVDLSDERGQVVRLRFRLSTGVAPLDATPEVTPETAAENTPEAPAGPVGYWIDNLTIQYFAIIPQPAFMPIDIGPRTLMGLHLTVGAQKEPVVDLARRLRLIGWPLGTLKGTSGTEEILNEVAKISPETVIVYRSLITPDGMVDCPNTSNDPVAEAQRWITWLQTNDWRTVDADYYEIMNECQPPPAWLVPFSIEAMRLAGMQNQCLLLFSFGPGNPDPDYFNQLLPAYQYALDHPCQPGRYHGIALHAYGVNKAVLLSESGLYLGLHHRLLYALLLPQLPNAIQIPVYLTEAGAGDGRLTAVNCNDVVRDVIQYTAELEADPYVRGFELWNVGPSSTWVDVTPCLPMLGDALVNYYSAKPR